eukprot:TRINITY_DN644_c0_g1_i3.p1 TRINITY_DN644_c0_g1~~TRINITY_DN644_c0_g1_i3.p1  ORF type:complete len:285 (+),score=90.42 TRINITY_DN644_c0_g1_i3:367-1221(+)
MEKKDRKRRKLIECDTEDGGSHEELKEEVEDRVFVFHPMKERKAKSREWMPETFEMIKEVRRRIVAPVDHSGCETLADEKTDPPTRRFHLLVGLMLSSQTKDEQTAAAHKRLRKSLPGGLTVDSIRSAEEQEIQDLLFGIGFHRRKAQYLKRVADILHDKFDGDTPSELDDVLKLPGVGPKMAYLFMLCAWNRALGIGVDVHVHRISNRLGWASNTKTPEDTRKELEDWIPKEYWTTINHTLVGFGQTVCLPQRPLCHECPLRGMCPSSQVSKPKQDRKHSKED